MSNTTIRWIGTIIIVSIGILVAYKLTHNWKITEQKVYKLSVVGRTFTLLDGKILKLDISLVFKDKKEAELASEKQDELTYDLNGFIKEFSSSRFEDKDNIDRSRYELMEKLKNKGYNVEFVTFDSNPVTFEY